MVREIVLTMVLLAGSLSATAAAPAPGATGAASAPDLQTLLDEMLTARHKEVPGETQEDPVAAARFRAGLDRAVAVVSSAQSDEKTALDAATYAFIFCDGASGAGVQKCQQLMPRVRKVVLQRYANSKQILGIVNSAGPADAALIDALIDKNGDPQMRSKIATKGGELWASKFHDREQSEAARQEAYGKVVKYAGIMLADTSVTNWGGHSIAMTRVKGEGLLNSVRVMTPGKVMPDTSYTTLAKQKTSFASFRSKVVLVDFWATWCVPCVATMPHIAQLRQELAGKPFEAISIDVGDTIEQVISAQKKKLKMPWVNWHMDNSTEDYFRIGLGSLPTYFVLDPNGVILIRATHFDADVQRRIREAVAVAGKS